MISITQKVDTLTPFLVRITAGLADMTPVMQDLGEYFIRSTKERFASGKAPDGTPWRPKSPVTLAKYGARNSNKAPSRPLFGPSGMLSSQIFAEADANSVSWGSNMVYAAMMHFGGTRAQWPHLWGDIPARPFLGVSPEDEAKFPLILGPYLSRLAAQP